MGWGVPEARRQCYNSPMNSDLSGTRTTTRPRPRPRPRPRHKMPFLGRTLCRGPTNSGAWIYKMYMYVTEPHFLHYKKTWNALDRNVTITTCLVVRLLARMGTSKTKIWNNAVRTHTRLQNQSNQSQIEKCTVRTRHGTRKGWFQLPGCHWSLSFPFLHWRQLNWIWNVTSNVGLSCCSSPKQVWDRFVVISHFQLPHLKPDPNKTLWEKTQQWFKCPWGSSSSSFLSF